MYNIPLGLVIEWNMYITIHITITLNLPFHTIRTSAGKPSQTYLDLNIGKNLKVFECIHR